MTARWRQRALICLAVLALVVQQVVVLGHVHSQRQAAVAGWLGLYATLQAGERAPAPGLPPHGPDDCELCWAQAVSSHQVLPEAPVVRAPDWPATAIFAIRHEALRPRGAPLMLRTRGPPPPATFVT